MSELLSPPKPRVFLETARTDRWWVGPLVTLFGLLGFIAYATWAALQGEHYEWGPYVSPFYAIQVQPAWWPLPPALLMIWIPAGFRMTCYYFRKAYYRAIFFTPPACAVGSKPQNYKGERALMIFNNLHRYFLYLALVLVVIHVIDTWEAFFFSDGFGVGVGSLILLVDLILLAGFVFGCNALRHLVGGNVNCYSCESFGKARYKGWNLVTRFNQNHREWAWLSLASVGLADLYIRLVSMGIITDLRIF